MPVAPCLPKQESIFLVIIIFATRYQGCAQNRLLASRPLVVGEKQWSPLQPDRFCYRLWR
jgi:hypothetical protein